MEHVPKKHPRAPGRKLKSAQKEAMRGSVRRNVVNAVNEDLGDTNVVDSLSKTSFLYWEGGWRILAWQRVPKPSAALPRAAGRLPEDCRNLPAACREQFYRALPRTR